MGIRTMRNITKGITLFNEGRFFDAHEAWEHEWLAAPEGAEKQFLQGLIMLAGALHKHTKGEYPGSLKLLAKCNAALKALPSLAVGIDLDALRDEVETFYRRLGGCSRCLAEEDYPRIREHEAVNAA